MAATRRGARTRQQIVEEAARLFNTHGFAGTSVNQVLDATGVAKGALYNHFASKEALALAAFDHAVAPLRTMVDQALGGDAPPEDRILAMLEGVRQIAHHRALPGGCPLTNTAAEADDAFPELRAKAIDLVRAWRTRLAGVLAEVASCGRYLLPAPPEELAGVMISMLQGAGLIAQLLGDASAVDDAVAFLHDRLEDCRITPA